MDEFGPLDAFSVVSPDNVGDNGAIGLGDLVLTGLTEENDKEDLIFAEVVRKVVAVGGSGPDRLVLVKVAFLSGVREKSDMLWNSQRKITIGCERLACQIFGILLQVLRQNESSRPSMMWAALRASMKTMWNAL